MLVQALISMDRVTLAANAVAALKELYVDWEVITELSTRQLVDVIIDDSHIAPAMTMIITYAPVIIGAWSSAGLQYKTEAVYDDITNPDGEVIGAIVYPFDAEEYLKFVPSGEIIHEFYGWARKQMPTH